MNMKHTKKYLAAFIAASLVTSPFGSTGIFVSHNVTNQTTIVKAASSETSVNDANEEEQTVTIYYYSRLINPHIYATTDTGAWLADHALKMEPVTNMKDYNYKITLKFSKELGSGIKFFIAGENGAIDFPNGKKYSVGIGTFGLKDSVITPLGINTGDITFTKDESFVFDLYPTNFGVEPTGGSGSYSYHHGVILDGTEYYIYKDFTSENYLPLGLFEQQGYGFTNKLIGTHTYFIDVKDNNTGEIVRVTKDYKVSDMYIADFTYESTTSRVEKGARIKLNATVKGEATHRYNSYWWYVTKDGVNYNDDIEYTNNYDASWVPSEAGDYEIRYQVNTYFHQYDTKTINVHVDDSEANTLVIYYYNSNWFNDINVHYKVDGGHWTKTPGEQMYQVSYLTTRKAIINLGTAEGATVCFNNGKGSWDNNNKKNYYLTKGSYEIFDGVVTKREKQPVVPTFTPIPSIEPTTAPTETPTAVPTTVPTVAPTEAPTEAPTVVPTVVPTEAPTVTPTLVPTETPVENQATIYYKRAENTSWKNAYIHYKVNGAWTTSPGVKMEKVQNGYWKITINMGDATELKMCFNNGNGTWDNNNKNNYVVAPGNYEIDQTTKTITNLGSETPTTVPTTVPTAVPTTTPTTEPTTAPTTAPTETPVKKTVTIYYKSSWKTVYIHYKLDGSWTKAPGVKMTKVQDGLWKFTTELGDDAQITACFNNGTGTWDNNNKKNYTHGEGTWRVNIPIVPKEEN